MSINIEKTPDMSLQDVALALNQGDSVMRSAHVGNLRGYNLAVADMGIPLLLVDHNVVIQTPEDREMLKIGDRNYLPGSIVTGEGITPLKIHGNLGGLSLKTEVTSPFSGAAMHLDQLHADSVRKAFPKTSVITNTEYLRSEEFISGEMVAILIQSNPELFQRLVEADGTLRSTAGSFASLADSYGILQLRDDPRRERGLLIPNDVDIVINFIIEALRSERATQIHLSGPDMVQYLKPQERRDLLSNLYETVRSQASFGSKLPEQITVKLVPSAEARFATTQRRITLARNIFALLAKRDVTINEQKRTFMQSAAARDPEARQAFLDATGLEEKAVRQELVECAEQAAEFLQDPRDAPFVSQYDILEEGIGIVRENQRLTMGQLSTITKQLRKFQRGTP